MQQDPSIRGAGRYRLLHLLSLDELGSVWAAEDSLRRHRVTVRQISNRLAKDPGFVDRVQEMGRGLIRFSHPNVASVLDLSAEARGALFIVMEPMHGQTLAERLRTRGPLPQTEARRIASCLADALHAAHRAGIEHGPVTPQNVMLTTEGDVKLMDFGLVSASEAIRTGSDGSGAEATGSSPLPPHPSSPSRDLESIGELMVRMLPPTLDRERDPPRSRRLQPSLQVSVFPRELLFDATRRARDPKLPVARAGRVGPSRRARVRAPQRPAARVARAPETVALGTERAVKTAGGMKVGRARRAIMGRPGPVLATAGVAAVAIVIVGILTLAGRQASEGPSVFRDAGRTTAEGPPTTPPSVAGGVEIPNLSGLSSFHAQERLGRLGLEFGGVLPVTGTPGVVVATSPRAGEQVGPGTVITLMIGARTDRMEGASTPG